MFTIFTWPLVIQVSNWWNNCKPFVIIATFLLNWAAYNVSQYYKPSLFKLGLVKDDAPCVPYSFTCDKTLYIYIYILAPTFWSCHSYLNIFLFIYLFTWFYMKYEKLCYAIKIKYSDQGIVYELIWNHIKITQHQAQTI